MPSVLRATAADRPAFLEWAAAAEPLFGPMVGVPEFEHALDRALASGDALVALDESGAAIGGLLLGREAREVAWLVVAPAARGHGAGAALVEAALAALGAGPVVVETFAAEVAAGASARRLYERLGFAPTGERSMNPAGIATERLLRRQ